LLNRQIEFLRRLFPAGRIAASIQAEWLERCRAVDAGVLWVPVDPEAPALASAQALARALPLKRWSFLYHVDMRVWEPALFGRLSGKIETEEADAFVPVHAGRRGHPVLFSPALNDALLALAPATERLDFWLHSLRVVEVEVPDACVHDNWNT